MSHTRYKASITYDNLMGSTDVKVIYVDINNSTDWLIALDENGDEVSLFGNEDLVHLTLDAVCRKESPYIKYEDISGLEFDNIKNQGCDTRVVTIDTSKGELVLIGNTDVYQMDKDSFDKYIQLSTDPPGWESTSEMQNRRKECLKFMVNFIRTHSPIIKLKDGYQL